MTAATRIGFPVALKAQGPDLVHKSDVGGVMLGLQSAAEVEQAWATMKERVGSGMTAAVVQRMAGVGVELIAGVVRDDLFGPLVLFGMGGTMAELIRDRAVRVAPVGESEAMEVVRSLRCSPLLEGYRGAEPVDVAALGDLLVRLGLLARDVPEISELDLNPVIASPGGIVAVDARVRIAPPPPNARSSSPAQEASPHPAPSSASRVRQRKNPALPPTWRTLLA